MQDQYCLACQLQRQAEIRNIDYIDTFRKKQWFGSNDNAYNNTQYLIWLPFFVDVKFL